MLVWGWGALVLGLGWICRGKGVAVAEIKCPNCGTVISLEQSDLDSVVRQVRDEEFSRELLERQAAFEADKQQAVKLARAEEKSAAKDDLNAKEARIVELKAQLQAQQAQAEARLQAQMQQAQAQAQAQQAQAETQLQAQQAQAEAQAQAQMQQAQARHAEELSQLKAQVEKLQAQLDSQAGQADARQQLAVAHAVAAVEKERDQVQAQADRDRDRLQATIEVRESEKTALEAQLREEMARQLEARDSIIALREEEIERMKEMRSRLSTKMVGESLEQHCQDEFNRIRAVAFPNAYFEKDTQTVAGTKGDFIFREEDGQGNEVLSIMFEMKNEGDTDSRKTHNEDHLAKLDKDRRNKGCEYAVLVSLLEPQSELYNAGIVDVSHRFPKMYVIRPQFFIPIISLLRNAAMNALQYKQEAALMRQQNLDIANFEEQVDAFKNAFFRNYKLASDRFTDAIDGIDKTIKLLERIRDDLTKSGKHLTAANNKLDDLTVKKLTKGSPTVRAMFEELREGGAQADFPQEDDAEAAEVGEAGEAAEAAEPVEGA